jgi:kynurenine formamidase
LKSRFQTDVPRPRSIFAATLGLCSAFVGGAAASLPAAPPAQNAAPKFVDLSLLVAPDYPATWPAGFLPFEMIPYERIGPLSPYNSDLLLFDENTGTQFDAPTHSVAPPGSGLPNAGPFGTMSSEKVPPWQFAGEACVIDVRDMATSAPKGRSDLIPKDRVISWQKEHRPLQFGDVAFFRSDYSDRFYKPLPAGRRYLADPIEGVTPAWPDPSADGMEYLASLGVLEAGTDSPSMGPIPPPLGDETHYAGLKHGMIWTEGATHLGQLPATGAFYCMLSPKVIAGIGGAGRGFAIVDVAPSSRKLLTPGPSPTRGEGRQNEEPPPRKSSLPSPPEGDGLGVRGPGLAARLIDSARHKRAIDLSVELTEDTPLWWPGQGVGRARHAYGKYGVYPHKQQRHILDSNTGTHLVPPAYSLPPPGFDNRNYSTEVQMWLAEYESKYGPRGTSEITAEKVPLSQTCGPVRIIDVRHLVGTTDRKTWPSSPEITPAVIRQYEQTKGELQPGEIVIFQTEHVDRFCKPFPEGKACLENPLNGKAEGWPSLGPNAVEYLAAKGIRCVATDAPTLGGVDPKRALWTYWLLASRGMVGVEYLKNVAALPKDATDAYFLFAPLKIRDCHGGPGRAIVFY